LPPLPAQILEIGCSSGEAIKQISDLGYDCVALDLPRTLESITTYPNINYVAMNIDGPDATEYPKNWKERFDAVIMGEVLQHTIFDENVLYKCWQFLKTDGTFLMSTENEMLANHSVHYYPTDILLKMLEVLGFNVVEYTTKGQHRYIWLHAKKLK